MTATPVLLGVIAALLQASVLPAFYLDPWAAPLLPAALIGAWAATRRPEETWTIALAGSLILGIVSAERMGWFLMALMPSVGIAMVLGTIGARHHNFGARLARAAAAAGAGTACYVAMLAIASGHGTALAAVAPQIAIAALGSAVIAGGGVVALRPLRVRPSGLYT